MKTETILAWAIYRFGDNIGVLGDIKMVKKNYRQMVNKFTQNTAIFAQNCNMTQKQQYFCMSAALFCKNNAKDMQKYHRY